MSRIDRSVLEAASWRLASELVRRHPSTTRLVRAHPGGGQSDCLMIIAVGDARGDVRLNRHGTIQVVQRFDGHHSRWRPAEWDEYLRSDPHEFLLRLEASAGLPAPSAPPAATPTTLTYQVLAELASTAVNSGHSIDIEPAFVDTSGYGGGPNRLLTAFTSIDAELLRPRSDDLFGEPGYRFWIVVRDDEPVLAFEQHSGLAWDRGGTPPLSLMSIYEQSGQSVIVTALELLRRVAAA